MSFDVNEVRGAAEGRWPEICAMLAPQLAPAMERIGTHVPCPVHGGQDGFRLFKDFPKSGGGICNTCGAKPDGFELIAWVNGWSFSQTVNAVAASLGLRDRGIPTPIRPVAKGGSSPRVGRLVESGEAPYRFKENAPSSFYVKLMQENGRECVLWGRDLARAVESSGALSGDWVTVSRIGKQSVRVDSRVREMTVWSVVKRSSPEEERAAEADAAKRTADEDARRAERIDAVWAESEPISSKQMSSVEAYLSQRGIEPPPAILRCGALAISRDVPFRFEDGRTGRFDTLTAAVRDASGRLVTIHRTFITPEGRKVDSDSPKRIMALPSDRTILGCSVQLGRPRKVLAVAEGIETALSVVKGLRIPCWAALSAIGLEHFEPPEDVQMVFIMADKDRSEVGQKAAEKLAARLRERGLLVYVFVPEGDIPEGAKGVDWNDVLMKEGVAGFPAPFAKF